MAHKDPFYYYLIIPLALLIIQVVCVILIHTMKQSILKRLEQVNNFFKTDNSDYRIVTRKEAEMRAHKKEQERMADNHATLTQQGMKGDKNG